MTESAVGIDGMLDAPKAGKSERPWSGEERFLFTTLSAFGTLDPLHEADVYNFNYIPELDPCASLILLMFRC